MPVSFSYSSFQEAVTDLMSPATSLEGVQKLRRLSATEDYDLKTLTEACLEYGVFDWLLQSLEYCGDADEPERTKETLWVFTNLAVSSEGCTVLLERGVTEKLCCVLRPGQPDDIVENALWALGNIAGENRAAVESLIERGVFAHVCRYLTEVFEGTFQVRVAVHKVLSWTISNFLRVKPPLPFRMAMPILPQLFHALRSFASLQNLSEALTDTLWSISYVFREESEGVIFDYLFANNNEIFLLMLAQLHGSRMNRAPALRLVGNVAALDGGTSTRVFTAPALQHLQRLAATIAPTDNGAIKELFWTLSNLLAEGPTIVSRVLESNVLQTLIPRVSPPPCNGVVKSIVWSNASEMSWVLYNVMTESRENDGGRATAALALLDSGALHYCAQTLTAASLLSSPPPSGLLNRLLRAVRLMIEVGGPHDDTEDAEMRNVFLAAFLAAGGRNALVDLIQNEASSVDALDEAMQLLQGCGEGGSASQPAQESSDADAGRDNNAQENNNAEPSDETIASNGKDTPSDVPE